MQLATLLHARTLTVGHLNDLGNLFLVSPLDFRACGAAKHYTGAYLTVGRSTRADLLLRWTMPQRHARKYRPPRPATMRFGPCCGGEKTGHNISNPIQACRRKARMSPLSKAGMSASPPRHRGRESALGVDGIERAGTAADPGAERGHQPGADGGVGIGGSGAEHAAGAPAPEDLSVGRRWQPRAQGPRPAVEQPHPEV